MKKNPSVGRSEAFRRAMLALMSDKSHPWLAPIPLCGRRSWSSVRIAQPVSWHFPFARRGLTKLISIEFDS